MYKDGRRAVSPSLDSPPPLHTAPAPPEFAGSTGEGSVPRGIRGRWPISSAPLLPMHDATCTIATRSSRPAIGQRHPYIQWRLPRSTGSSDGRLELPSRRPSTPGIYTQIHINASGHGLPSSPSFPTHINSAWSVVIGAGQNSSSHDRCGLDSPS
jgi:hypothetical protein